MNATNPDFDDEEPIDPAVEAIRRRMLRLQIISIAIMMVGLFAVIGAVIFKFSKKDADEKVVVSTSALSVPAGVNYAGSVDIPEGAVVESSSLNGSHVLLQLKLSTGATQIWLYDVAAARVFGKIDVN